MAKISIAARLAAAFLAPRFDREVGDLVPDVPLAQDLGRDFLYARYDAELTREGLDDLGLAAIDPARVAKLDSIAAIDELLLVGRRYAEKYVNTQSHLGPFLPAGSGGYLDMKLSVGQAQTGTTLERLAQQVRDIGFEL